MAVELTKEIIDLLAESDTTKVLATLDANGLPHAVVKQSLQPGEDGTILYLELLESSRPTKSREKHLVRQSVAIALKGKDGRSWQIKGKPVKTHITGPLFQEHYIAVRERLETWTGGGLGHRT
jgi:hypothetical protein